MKRLIKGLGEAKIKYYVNGSDPKLLILSGIHGDEYEVIACVRKEVNRHLKELPDFLYIPVVSPSAVENQTRENKDGKDLNRKFFDDSDLDEIKVNISILKKYRFDLALDFHEDVDRSDFYLYDCLGEDLEGTDTLRRLREEIRSLGVGLLNGVDDPDDPILGETFVEGYKHFPAKENYANTDGTLGSWAFSHQLIRRYLNPEVPGKVPFGIKEKIVGIIFRHLFLTKSLQKL